MIIFDIIVGVLLILALWNGYRKGFFVQLAGLAGLLIGIWLAMRTGTTVGSWLGIDAKYASVAGFVIVLVVVILLIALVGRLFKNIFGFAGLSMLDKLGGLILSLAKTVLILGIVFWGFDSLNRPQNWVAPGTLDRSVFYRPLVNITHTVFPYLDNIQDALSPLYRNDRGAETNTSRNE